MRSCGRIGSRAIRGWSAFSPLSRRTSSQSRRWGLSGEGRLEPVRSRTRPSPSFSWEPAASRASSRERGQRRHHPIRARPVVKENPLHSASFDTLRHTSTAGHSASPIPFALYYLRVAFCLAALRHPLRCILHLSVSTCPPFGDSSLSRFGTPIAPLPADDAASPLTIPPGGGIPPCRIILSPPGDQEVTCARTGQGSSR